jgi:hypothetical protein
MLTGGTMHIFLTIIGETKEPLKLEFHGNYAIEIMLFKVSERYFGVTISEKIKTIIQGSIG